MSRLPAVPARKCIRAPERAGFRVTRRRGSHVRMIRDDPLTFLTIPNHATIAPGTLKAILRRADPTIDELRRLL